MKPIAQHKGKWIKDRVDVTLLQNIYSAIVDRYVTTTKKIYEITVHEKNHEIPYRKISARLNSAEDVGNRYRLSFNFQSFSTTGDHSRNK